MSTVYTIKMSTVYTTIEIKVEFCFKWKKAQTKFKLVTKPTDNIVEPDTVPFGAGN